MFGHKTWWHCRPPPEILTLVKTSLPRSRIATFNFGFSPAMFYGCKNPAAPAPTIIISYFEFIYLEIL
jgi:hypothetical protein